MSIRLNCSIVSRVHSPMSRSCHLVSIDVVERLALSALIFTLNLIREAAYFGVDQTTMYLLRSCLLFEADITVIIVCISAGESSRKDSPRPIGTK
jgi:hypothetical protein